jgi:hypothetical protein
LLRGKPEFVLDTQAKLAQGDWQGKLTLNFQDYGDIDPAQNPAALLGALQKGLAEVAASKSLAETVLTNIAKEQLPGPAGGTRREAGEQAMQSAWRRSRSPSSSKAIDGRWLRPAGRGSLQIHGAFRGRQAVRERQGNPAGGDGPERGGGIAAGSRMRRKERRRRDGQ